MLNKTTSEELFFGFGWDGPHFLKFNNEIKYKIITNSGQHSKHLLPRTVE
jgi:hypothetical protein